MLLAVTSIDESTVLVGGTGGALGIVDRAGLQEFWKQDGGDVVAVDAAGTRQIAIVESDDESAAQSLLCRDESGKWIRYGACF